MGIERNNGLAGKIIFIKERVEDHWHIAPPVGIADKNRVVLFQIFNPVLDGRPCIIILFLRCQIHQCVMVGRIRSFRLNAKNICTCVFLDNIGHILGVSQNLSVNDYNAVVFFLCHVIRIRGLRHGEINNQRIGIRNLSGLTFFLRRFRIHHLLRCLRFCFCYLRIATTGGKTEYKHQD